MLEKVFIVDPPSSAHKYPHELSGGQQQRVVIALALACNPDLLILDEPTTGLDVTTEANILDLIDSLKERYGSAILFITHNLGVIAKVSDHLGVMYAGNLVEGGSVGDIFQQPFHPYTEGLLNCIPKIEKKKAKIDLQPIKGTLPDLHVLPKGCIFHPRCPYAEEICRKTEPNLIRIEDGRESACMRWQQIYAQKSRPAIHDGDAGGLKSKIQETSPGAGNGQLIDLKSVKKYFGGISIFERLAGAKEDYVHAVDDVSLAISPGQVFGLVGESGCGKSTLGRSLVKLLNITEGDITYEDKNIWKLNRNENKAYCKNVQIIFQNPDSSLNPKKTIHEILARPLRFYKNIKESQLENGVTELLKMVRLRQDYGSRFPYELSGGEKQRVGIARAFAADPQFIVCDEPVSALDVSVQASILNLLLDLQRNFQVALLFISHDLSVVQHISHKIGVMYLGKLCETGETDQVFSPPFHPYTQALLSAVPRIGSEEESEVIRLTGPVPSAKTPPEGCRFHTRCPQKIGPICEDKAPPEYKPAAGHSISCHLYA
jgi:peptide/nickel transport system ATP-binding protein